LQSECERELRLIQDLLDLQHLKAGVYPLERSTLNIYHWLEHIIEPFKTIAESQQQTLEIFLSPALPSLITDGACLKRILTELLNNACKYTPREGTITVTAVAVPAAQTAQGTEGNPTQYFPKQQFSKSCPLPSPDSDVMPSYLLLSVINMGVEIPPEECTRIFDQFYRIPSNDPWKHGGTGLGLALVKRIVELLSGSIYATSTAGQTCFTVELPIEIAIASAETTSDVTPDSSLDFL
jgi:signal transduction histidine kinase